MTLLTFTAVKNVLTESATKRCSTSASRQLDVTVNYLLARASCTLDYATTINQTYMRQLIGEQRIVFSIRRLQNEILHSGCDPELDGLVRTAQLYTAWQCDVQDGPRKTDLTYSTQKAIRHNYIGTIGCEHLILEKRKSYGVNDGTTLDRALLTCCKLPISIL